MLDDTCLSLVLASSHDERDCNLVPFIHLRKDKADRMLQQRAAFVKILWQETLTNRDARLFCVQFSQGEHSSISVEKGIILIVEKNLFEKFYDAKFTLGTVVEGRCRVISPVKLQSL